MTAPSIDWQYRLAYQVRSSANRVVQGVIAATHNSMAILGLVLAVFLTMFITQPDLRNDAEEKLLGWLQQRQASEMANAGIASEPNAIERVTASDPGSLPKSQAQVADWLSRKYSVAQEPLSALVSEAYAVGKKVSIDPTLILAVMAIESRFNPFAASSVGAHGLMQVMTRVHTEKYEGFGGTMAAFDPVTNRKVGVQVLHDTIRRAGSVEGGLRLYVGAVNNDGSDYVDKVLSEHDRLKRVAQGQRVPFNAFQRATAPANPSAPPQQAKVAPETTEANAAKPLEQHANAS